MILPCDAVDAPEICRHCYTAVWQDADDIGLVLLNPSVQCECAVSHTLLVSLDKAEEVLSMRFLISASVDRLFEMIEPKKVTSWTIVMVCSLILMDGALLTS